MTSVNPAIGETWYFLIGDAVCCTMGEIIDITKNTATIKQEKLWREPLVYARSKITFVERVMTRSNYMCDND